MSDPLGETEIVELYTALRQKLKRQLPSGYAEDIVHDTILKLLERPDSLRDPESWLNTVSWRVHVDAQKRANTLISIDPSNSRGWGVSLSQQDTLRDAGASLKHLDDYLHSPPSPESELLDRETWRARISVLRAVDPHVEKHLDAEVGVLPKLERMRCRYWARKLGLLS